MRSPRRSLHVRLPRVPLTLGWLGSLQLAVPLLIAIAMVLAWGTLYEARFGTAAVQRFVYRAWWFQALLGFLAVNLALAAWQRYPWKRQHLPFVLAHVGIILILLGGILGGRFGIEGNLIIPEGQSQRLLQLPANVLVVHQPNPSLHAELPTNFEATAWLHEPNAVFRVPLGGRILTLTVDRYYPDAMAEEEVTNDATSENPAIHVVVRHEDQEERLWLVARDPERFGVRWGEAHLFFLEPETDDQLRQLLASSGDASAPRGILSVRLPNEPRAHLIPVPAQLDRPIAIDGTPYTVTFKDYFADFALGERGPVSRSEDPNNPAVAFTLSGPEGTDAHLLFALHPDFEMLHARLMKIASEVRYTHASGTSLPPQSIAFILPPAGVAERGRRIASRADGAPSGGGIIRRPSSEGLSLVMTGTASQRERVDAVQPGHRYRHPALGYEVDVEDIYHAARLATRFTNRSDDVKAEAVHVIVQEGTEREEAWLGFRGSAELSLGKEPVLVEYRPAQRALPVVVKLLDFRKIDYPGTQMAAGFESDVEVTDPQRGLVLIRKISMNNPLRYRGYSFFQSSYVPGEVETTVLAVRNDCGTPLVYAGFLVVIGGVASLFIGRRRQSRRRMIATHARTSQ